MPRFLRFTGADQVAYHRGPGRNPDTHLQGRLSGKAESKTANCQSATAIFVSIQEEAFRHESENVTNNRHRIERLEAEIHRVVLQ
jgi:hypothetical protein